MTAAEADRLGLDVATVQGVLNPAIQHKELDDLDETRRILDDLRHAAAALSRACGGMHSRDSPQKATEGPQSGFRPQARGVVPPAHENPPQPVFFDLRLTTLELNDGALPHE